MDIYMFVHEYNKHAAHSHLTFLPTFNTHQLPKGHTSLQQHLDRTALIPHRGTCRDACAPQTYHLLVWVWHCALQTKWFSTCLWLNNTLQTPPPSYPNGQHKEVEPGQGKGASLVSHPPLTRLQHWQLTAPVQSETAAVHWASLSHRCHCLRSGARHQKLIKSGGHCYLLNFHVQYEQFIPTACWRKLSEIS